MQLSGIDGVHLYYKVQDLCPDQFFDRVSRSNHQAMI